MTKLSRVPKHSLAQQQTNSESAVRLHALLVDVVAKPEMAPPALIASWASQGELAGLSIPELKISPMSLNTLKGHVNQSIAGGWEAFEVLRAAARQRHKMFEQKEHAPSRGSRADLQTRLDIANSEVQRHIDSLAEMSEMYFDVLAIARRFADKHEGLRVALDRHRRRFAPRHSHLRIVPKA